MECEKKINNDRTKKGVHKFNKSIKEFAKKNKGKLKGKNLLVEGTKAWKKIKDEKEDN